MTRAELHREVLRLGVECSDARVKLKQAQTRARLTGRRAPLAEYNSLWDRVNHTARALVAAELALANADEAEAVRFMAAARTILKPHTLGLIEAAMLAQETCKIEEAL
jgi:hypothetical protein